MPPIEIYTSPTCGYCFAAKQLLMEKGASFTELKIQMHPERWAEMVQRAVGQRGRMSDMAIVGHVNSP